MLMEFNENDIRVWRRKDAGGTYYAQLPGRAGWISTGHNTKSAALRWAIAQANGQDVHLTFGEYAAPFFLPGECRLLADLVSAGKSGSDRQWSDLRRLVQKYLIPEWGRFALTVIQPAPFFRWLREVKSVEDGKLLSTTTRNRLQTTMIRIMDYAVYEGVITENRLKTAPRIAVRTEERGTFTEAELSKLFPTDRLQLVAVWGSVEMAVAMLIIRDAGLRPSELVSLRWESWRPKYQGFIVHPTKTATKGAKVKAALVSDQTAKLIKDHAPDFGDVSPWGRVDTLGKQFVKLAGVQISLAGRTLYCLRHTANTRLRTEAGDDAARLVMGHTTVAMTEHYDHPDEIAVMERARKLVK